MNHREFPNTAARDLIHGLIGHYADRPGFVALTGKWGLGEHNSTSFVFLEPVLRISSNTPDWSLLQDALDDCEDDSSGPLLAGYLAYEMLHGIENITAVPNKLGVPLLEFYLHRTVVSIPADPALAVKVSRRTGAAAAPIWEAENLEELLRNPPSMPASSPVLSETDCLDLARHSNFSRSHFIEAVNEIRELIRLGEVYQVNLTQQFSLPARFPAARFHSALMEACRPEFGALLRCSDSPAFSIVSSSPELFAECDGKSLLSSPIKGTAPRSLAPELDRRAASELLESDKNRAELAMIVDLIRNDMGRVARTGSVEVLQHARLASLSYVHHLVSDVRCRLRPEARLTDCLRALFPCGSISGAPKVAAMEQISRLEQRERGVYCGAIGWLGGRRTMKLSVAIRTAMLLQERLVFGSGGGIVYDSAPEEEYLESLAKTRAITAAWERARAPGLEPN